MPRTRRDIWKLGNDWHVTILWYARAVKALSERPFKEMTSWRYLAAMHGIAPDLWAHNGYLKAGEPVPDTTDFKNEDRDQCQHQTWYFLPWHRGYLRAFEKIVADAVTKQGGPKDWALPYWNYNDPTNANRFKLPPAFSSETWPDGGPNPLFVKARYGATGKPAHPIMVDDYAADLKKALTDSAFTTNATGGSTGFGGGRTPFQHSANDRSAEGMLEQSPHDNIHGDIGGSLNNSLKRIDGGLMSNPSTAGLDPIFWLHHANVDRLWEVWLKRNSRHENPKEGSWLDGPNGPRSFVMPEPDNKTRSKFVPSDMLDTTAPKLDYIYEDDTDPFPNEDRISLRMRNLGFAQPTTIAAHMAKAPQVELLGASKDAVRLSGPEAQTRVLLDAPVSRKAFSSFRRNEFAGGIVREPDRIFLNLENITGSSDAASFNVYVGLKPDDNPTEHPANLAGTVTLFGVSEASELASSHGGNGLTKVLEITEMLDRLHLTGVKELNELPVRFVLRRGRESDVSIGRVSIYRQGE
jgi:tyrosinase